MMRASKAGARQWRGTLSTAALAGAVALVLAGCAVGPDYRRPEVARPARFKEAGDWKVADPRDGVTRGAWWSVYGDPMLDALEQRLVQSNQSLAAAEAAYRSASAVARQAEASLWPTLTASAGITRSQSPVSTSQAGTAGSGRPQSGTTTTGPSNLRQAQVAASWEPDLWGGLRRAAENGRESATASLRDYEAARLSLTAELATDYFDLRVADATEKLLQETLEGYQRSLKITQNQYAVGVAGRVDVAEAETQLRSTAAQAVDVQIQRSQLEHAIAVLVGVAPAEFSIPVDSDWKPPTADTPVLVAGELLERRPDIAAAERRVAAANAEIGVARAAWFPTLTLSAAGGYESLAASHWFTLPNRFWSLGPQLAETLFDGGRRRAVSAQAWAAYDEAVANYRQTALAAFQDVEDSLVSLRVLREESDLQQSAVKSARETVTLTLNQYKAGTVSYLNVVTVQATALTNERTQLSIVGRQLGGSVGLIRGLGGGWDPAAAPPPAPPGR